VVLVAAIALASACTGEIGAPVAPTDFSARTEQHDANSPIADPDGGPRGRLDADEYCPPPPPPMTDGGTGPAPVDELEPGRLFRRASLALRGYPPTDLEYDALDAAPDGSAFVAAFVDRTLTEPAFYDQMFELARDWLHVPLVAATADVPEYGLPQQRALIRCPASSAHAGKWVYYRFDDGACDGRAPDGSPAAQITIEPWWAPGTTVDLIGFAASTEARGISDRTGTPVAISCTGKPEGTCGCGPNAARCYNEENQYPGYANYLPANPHAHRRLASEEPARLFAHLAWHDRPVTDLVLGAYSVAPTVLQGAYVMQGLEGGAMQLLTDDRWWKPERFVDAPRDPHHAAGDPWAWREVAVSDRNPYLLPDRDYKYDPRTERGPMRGIPAAGMLTSPGFLTAYPRERVRAARALEALACEVLAPPSERAFNVYRRDPAREGPCQTCHKRIDPAAIHFKRYMASDGYSFEGYGTYYYMPGIGPAWHWPARWRTGVYPYHAGAFAHWNRWYQPDTALTPVTTGQIAQNPEAVFIDFLPPDQSLLGQISDGTVGPLGFAKMIVGAGAYDKCVVRQLHKAVFGRDVDPGTEAGYLDQLVAHFLDGERKVRPFVKYLTTTDLFRKGR